MATISVEVSWCRRRRENLPQGEMPGGIGAEVSGNFDIIPAVSLAIGHLRPQDGDRQCTGPEAAGRSVPAVL